VGVAVCGAGDGVLTRGGSGGGVGTRCSISGGGAGDGVLNTRWLWWWRSSGGKGGYSVVKIKRYGCNGKNSCDGSYKESSNVRWQAIYRSCVEVVRALAGSLFCC
jgi:hypothetical protein